MRKPAKLFPGMYIADMHLDHRRLDCRNCITNRHRSMRIPSRINNDPIKRKTDPLQLIDQLPFQIALKIIEFHQREKRLQLNKILLERPAAIYLRLPGAEKIEIGAIDDCDTHTHCVCGSIPGIHQKDNGCHAVPE